MTREFDLASVQRAKMFPIVVRSTPGYDPAMQVAGGDLGLDPVAPTDEELQDLVEPDQQEQLEDKEVDRQLWWQDVFSRTEADLVNSTGGLPMDFSDLCNQPPPHRVESIEGRVMRPAKQSNQYSQ